MNVTIDYDPERRVFKIATDAVVPAIGEWMGWKRQVRGGYTAPGWPSSVLAVKPGPSVQVAWTEGATKARDTVLTTLSCSQAALQGVTTAAPELVWPAARKPRKHQMQGINALRHMRWRSLLADDMGLGKTSTALWAAHDAGVQRILVICPVSVKYNWEQEIKLTLGEKWLPVVVDGSAKQRIGQLAQADAYSTAYSLVGSTAIIVNYDLLRHLTAEQHNFLCDFVRGGLLISDESHYIKDRESERGKLTHAIGAGAQYVIAMTGTPVRNQADDLFSQVELVRPGTWTSYRDFARRYLVIQTVKFGKRDVQKIVGTKNLTELNAVMNTLQIARKKADVLDLPPKVYTYPELTLDGDLLKLYKAMKEFAKMELSKFVGPPAPTLKDTLGVDVVRFGSLKVTDADIQKLMGPMTIWDPRAKSAVEQAMRCEQIAQGFVGGIPDPVMAQLGSAILKSAERIPGRPNELIFPSSPKILWVIESITAILGQGGAPIVFTRFNAPMLWLAARLEKDGIRARCMHGAVTAEERRLILQGYQDKVFDVLICQVKIAEGWNATRSQDVLFLGRDWSPAINAQAEDRCHRMGQRGTVNVQIPIVRKTIEVMIHNRLLAKQADSEQALKSVTIEELMEAL